MAEVEERSDDSIAYWLVGLKQGDNRAVTELWHRYFVRLVRLARNKLNAAPRQAADEEDVALSVFKSLCLRSARGEFEKLDDRDDLWRILVTITRCKAAAGRRHEGRKKWDFQRTQQTSPNELMSHDPSPSDLASLNDEREHLMSILPDDQLRQVARHKMDGDEIDEIAIKVNISPRSVDRKLQLIRATWEREIQRLSDNLASPNNG